MWHPDKSTGSASSSEKESYTVNSLGQTLTYTDRNGSVHTLGYDVLGRLVSDAVTTLGSGVNGDVRRMETAYDTAGRAYSFTSYDAATGGNIVNQVQREFNGLGQVTKEYQAHSGAVNTSTTPQVQYTYSEMASDANHSRLTKITYPSGYELNYNYSTGINDAISRLSSLSDSTGTLESYDYLGLDIVVRRGHSQPGVDLTYIKQSGESNGDAGDKYTGLDRFGRVVDQRWLKTSGGTHTDRFQYGYDRDNNRLYRENLIDAAFSELYHENGSSNGYDLLNQLTDWQRGTLNSTKDSITGTPSRTQEWDFDALGNFESQSTNGTATNRTHNKQNQVTGVGSATLTFDANGNMTTDETDRTFVYDAWNRLVAVKNSSGTTLISYKYDALGRRVVEIASGTTTDLYHSLTNQILEEREGTLVRARNVWSPVYVNAMVLRDRDVNGDGTLEERLWIQHDANWNVTALVNGSGTVVERYYYDAFGAATTLDASFAVRSGGSSYAWEYLFQGMRYESLSGLTAADRRWYSVTVGRWASIDPIRFQAGDSNFYRFVGNTPASATDPSGLDTAWIADGNVGGILYLVNPFGEWVVYDGWSLMFPPRSQSAIASPIKPNFNPNQTDRLNLKAGDVIDFDTRDWADGATQAFKSKVAETVITVAVVITPAMLEMRCTDYISKYRQAYVRGEFPSQFNNCKVKEVVELAKQGDKPALKAKKLLIDGRWWKPGIK
jgi:RHS repeat-associated protein